MSELVTDDCAAAEAATLRATATAASSLINFTRTSSPAAATSAPRHQPLDTRDSCQIVVDDCHHQHQDQDKTGEQHLLLDVQAEVAPGESLQRHDKDVASVEDGNRHEIQQAEIEADRGHQAEESDPAQLCRFT